MIWDAIYVDLDGTLVESQPFHDLALTRAARTASGFWAPFHARQFPGRSTAKLHAFAAQYGWQLPGHAALDAEVEEIRARKWDELERLLREEVTRKALDPQGTAQAAWEALARLDVPVAIVTDTPRTTAKRICRMLGVSGATIITRDDVGGVEKPHPAIYDLARQWVPGRHPVALEDSLRGAHAASAARVPTFLVHGPEGVLEWIAAEVAASTTTEAPRRTSSRRPKGSPRRPAPTPRRGASRSS